MSLIEKSSFYGKIAEENYRNYLKLVCEKLEAEIDIDSFNSADNIMSLQNKVMKADKTIDLMKVLVEKYKGLQVELGGVPAKWFTVLATAVYIYYFYYNKQKPYVALMYAREFTADIAKEARIPDNEFEFVLQAYESCLGVQGPQKLKPPPDTPGEMMALAVFIYENKEELQPILG